MEPQWLRYGKRLQAIATTGLHFTRDAFDRERFKEVEAIANQMLASLADVPIERIEGLVSLDGGGHATPKVDVRGALVENGSILLVRERSDGLWTLPGGFAEVGLSPARNVEKEILEEAGVAVSVTRLFGVRYKAISDDCPDIHDFYKMFFLCGREDAVEVRGGLETSEARFFAPDDLPALSRRRTVESDIAAAFVFASDPVRPAFFD